MPWIWILPVVLASVLLWSYLRELFASSIIPCLRRVLGDTLADAVADVFVWLDGGVTRTRATVSRVLESFRTKVRGIKSTFTWTSPGEVTAKSSICLQKDSGKGRTMATSVRRIAFNDLPPEIKRAMVTRGIRQVEMDAKKAFEARVEEKLELLAAS